MATDNRRARNRAYITARKNKDKCIRCHSNRNLTYHHRNPQEKEFAISEACRLKVSIARLEKEFDKCDPLCEQCHKLEHEDRIIPPDGFSSEEFSFSTLTDGGFTVILVYAATQKAYIGEHPTSRRLAHDQAFELFLEDINARFND